MHFPPRTIRLAVITIASAAGLAAASADAQGANGSDPLVPLTTNSGAIPTLITEPIEGTYSVYNGGQSVYDTGFQNAPLAPAPLTPAPLASASPQELAPPPYLTQPYPAQPYAPQLQPLLTPAQAPQPYPAQPYVPQPQPLLTPAQPPQSYPAPISAQQPAPAAVASPAQAYAVPEDGQRTYYYVSHEPANLGVVPTTAAAVASAPVFTSRPNYRAHQFYGGIQMATQRSLYDAYWLDAAGTRTSTKGILAYDQGYWGSARFGVISRRGLYGGAEFGAQSVSLDSSGRYANVGNQFYSFSGEVQSTFGLLHAGYEVQLGNRLSPFVEAGLGYSVNTSSGRYTLYDNNLILNSAAFGSGIDTSVIWSGSIGANLKVAENLLLKAGYRYQNFGRAQTGQATSGTAIDHDELTTHSIFIGAEVRF